jgi:hypothetical protein
MNEALSEAIREAFAIAPAHVVVYHTLEVRQEGVQAPVFMVQSHQPLQAYDENQNFIFFEPVGFQFSLPPSNKEGFRSLNVAIDNVSQRLVNFVETAKSQPVAVEMVYRPYLSTDLSKPQMIPPLVLYLKDLRITPSEVVGRATFMDLVNKKFPSELYTRSRFPTLGG